MNEEEQTILILLAEAWNCFVKLPDHHPDDIDEFRHGLHRLQEKVMARLARRSQPEFFS